MAIERDWHNPVFCGHKDDEGKRCGSRADYECTCGGKHPDETWKGEPTESHYRWLCEDHIDHEAVED